MATASSDVTGWQKWETVRTPQGEVLYKDPNKPGWVYDPVLSANKGRNVFRRDPTLEITKTQEAEDAQKKQQDLQNQAMSPAGQLVPVAAGTVGTVGGAWAINQWANGKPAATAADKLGDIAGIGKTPAQTPSVNPVNPTPPVADTASVAANTGSSSGVAQVLPPGQSPPPGMEVVGQTSDGGTMVAPTGANIPVGELGSIAAQAGVVLQAVRLGQQGLSAYERGRGQGAIGGATEGVKGDGGFMDTIQSFDPFALQARLLGGALGGIFGSKKTTQVQKERWSKLAENGAITPEQLAAKEADLSRSAKERSQDPITGQRWNIDTAMNRVKAGGTAADEFSLTLAPHKTFGVDWQSYTPDIQRQILATNAAEGNYTSDKGDVLFKDEAKAKEIKDRILSGGGAVASNTPTSVQQMMRTNTRSPGIDKNGKRISY